MVVFLADATRSIFIIVAYYVPVAGWLVLCDADKMADDRGLRRQWRTQELRLPGTRSGILRPQSNPDKYLAE